MAEPNKKLEIIKQRVFEFVVIKHPTIEEAEQGKGSCIIVDVSHVCAADEAQALMHANRAIPEEDMKYEARLEVVLRPF